MMQKWRMALILLSAICCFSITTSATAKTIDTNTKPLKPLVCKGPYKGQQLTQAQVNPILESHKIWLAAGAQPNVEGKANLCGADLHGVNLSGRDLRYIDFSGSDLGEANLQNTNLSHAELYKVYFRSANLTGTNFQDSDARAADLQQADMKNADLRRANFTAANFMNATMQNVECQFAILNQANLSETNLTNANFSWSHLVSANFSNANLTQANFNEAILNNSNFSDANLTAVNFTKADLHNANLTNANIKQVNFNQADLKQVLFQPNPTALPNLTSLTTANNFRHVRIEGTQGIAVMARLRAMYKSMGIRSMEREITAMIKTFQMRQAWKRGGWGYLESAFSYLFFYLTCDYGASPGRPLLIFLLLIGVFSIPYRVALSTSSQRSGIMVQWQSNRKITHDKAKPIVESQLLQMLLKRHHPTSWSSIWREQWRLWRIALYFSLMSAFGIGWRELNVSNWIAHMQTRDYSLCGRGWVRVLAGIQPIMSAYLVVFWVLTYFGRPFEW